MNTKIVIDNGSTKAGFSEESPRIVFPTLICRNKSTINKETFIKVDVDKKSDNLEVIAPIERGIIENWNVIQEIWNFTISKAPQYFKELYFHLQSRSLKLLVKI